MNKIVTLNLKANDYTSRVLGVVKAKYGLNDKGEALNKFVEMFGDEFIDKEVKEDVIKDVIDSCNYHIKKHGYRSRSINDLKKLIEE